MTKFNVFHFFCLKRKKTPLPATSKPPLPSHPNLGDLLFGYTRVPFDSGVECAKVLPVIYPEPVFQKTQSERDRQKEIFSQVESKWKYATLLVPYDIREEMLGDLLETRHAMLTSRISHSMTDPKLALSILKSWPTLCETRLQDYVDKFRRFI